MILERLDPELFLWELYDPNGISELDVALHVAARIGYCDASRLLVRPRAGMIALMVEWEDGTKQWYHGTEHTLKAVKDRLARRNGGAK